jgi:hypothetical protein
MRSLGDPVGLVFLTTIAVSTVALGGYLAFWLAVIAWRILLSWVA